MLWFKNIVVYRLNTEIALSMDELEQPLASLAFTPGSSQDL
ncbi:recombination-associated protein RdgC, partial [Proteus mirabilis]